MILKLFIVILLNLSFLFSHGEDHSHDNHQHKERKYKPAGIIRGSVIDNILEEGKAYANISIVKEDSDDIIAGGVTDEDGLFLIDKIPFGKYFLVAQYIGYEDMIIDGIVIRPPDKLELDLGKIKINAKTIMFEGVSVVDELAPIIEDIAKTTYPVAETARSEGGSADEVLEKLPSITVDADGNVSLRGNSNVTILIDGRKSQLSVDMINANMIEKVEVMTTPSAKFDPDGMAGIINIVLSKNEFVGRSGFITFNNAGFQDYDNSFLDGGQNIAGTFNSFNNNWNLFTNYSLSQKYRQSKGERSTTNIDQVDFTSTSISSIEKADKHPENRNFKSGLEYYLNNKSLIAFDITYIEHEGIDTTVINTIETDEDEVLTSIPERKNYETDQGNDLNYGFGYFWDDMEAKKSFSFQMDYDEHEDDKLIKSYVDNTLELTEVIQDNGKEYIYSLDYSSPIANRYNEDAKYELGLKVETSDDKHYTNVQGQDFNWKYDNIIAAGYFNVLYNFTEKFGIQTGARFEQQDKESSITYNQNFTCDDAEDEECNLFQAIIYEDEFGPVSYEHNRVYPTLYFLYDTKGKGNYKFELGRRIQRPGHWSLDPIPDLEDMDSKFIRRGNAHLNPEDIYKGEISYSNRLPIGFLRASIYYSRVTNKIDRDKTNETFNGEDYQVLTWDNIAKSTDRGIDFTFMTKPLPNWDLMINGNYWNNILDGEDADQQGSEYGFWGMMNSTIRLRNDQKIGMYSHFSSPMTLSTGEIKGMTRLDLSYKKKVNKRFNFTVKLKDVFDNSGFKIVTDQIIDYTDGNSYQESLVADHRRGKRTLSLNLEYRFGDFQKKKYRRQEGHGHSHGGEGMDVGY